MTPRTRALLPVHLYGQLADMRALGALAERHGLVVLEDACQAHGASREGVVPGRRDRRRRVQLLSRQEPRRDGRRRCARHRGRGSRGAATDAARARADGEVPPRARRLHVEARHDPGARAPAQAAAARRLERRAAEGGGVLRERAGGRRRPRPPACRLGEPPRLAPVRRADRRSGRARRVPRRARDRDREALSAAAAPVARLRAARACAEEHSRSPSASPRTGSPCPCSPASPRPSSSASSIGCSAYFARG